MSESGRIRVIAFGAHPDDCDIRAGGTAAKFAALGHAVKFVSVTNGDAGHHQERGKQLALRRRGEAAEAGRRLGVVYEVLEHRDGHLLATIEAREQIIRLIREWKADIVIGPRPNDYHPDHRYTGVLVQDAGYMVMVPNVCSDVPALRKNPVFLYFEDEFRKPTPFQPDIAVAIDDVWPLKVDAMDAHVSQVYEWLPWVDGVGGPVPKEPEARKEWLGGWIRQVAGLTPATRQALVKWYGPERACEVRDAEAFELCEYGSWPTDAELRRLFPILDP
ncbi:MAG TPA: PIG-L family deacetylase [Bryobacteraceae bacterium]|nr:PIG-L family deacetylase [Bryobacteraceae bacterium]